MDQGAFDLGDQKASNPRAVVGGNNPPSDDLDFIDSRIVLWGAEFLQFSYCELDDLFVSGKARAAKRRMGFRRLLSYCLSELVGQEAQARVMGLCRDTVGDDQAAVRKWCERDDEFAEMTENIRLGMTGFVRIKTEQERLEGRLAHWVAHNPRLKRKAEARDLIAQAAKKLSREARGVLARVITAETQKKRLPQFAFRELDPGLAECFALELVQDAEPHLSRRDTPERLVAPTKTGALVYAEAIALGLVQMPKRSKMSG